MFTEWEKDRTTILYLPTLTHSTRVSRLWTKDIISSIRTISHGWLKSGQIVLYHMINNENQSKKALNDDFVSLSCVLTKSKQAKIVVF